MADPLLTVDAIVTCPHGGQGTITPSQSAVVAGDTVCTESDDVKIEGCPFTIGTDPSPCVSVEWQSTSVSSTAGGGALLTTGSQGICLSDAAAPQGPVILIPAQAAAVAT